MGLSSFVLLGLLRLFHVLSNPLDTSHASSFPCDTYITVCTPTSPLRSTLFRSSSLFCCAVAARAYTRIHTQDYIRGLNKIRAEGFAFAEHGFVFFSGRRHKERELEAPRVRCGEGPSTCCPGSPRTRPPGQGERHGKPMPQSTPKTVSPARRVSLRDIWMLTEEGEEVVEAKTHAASPACCGGYVRFAPPVL